MSACERFQRFVGELGRDRREYLYEMRYWEILLIERGYYHRNILQYQLQRLQAYGAIFAMSGDKKQKGPEGWIPLYFDHYKMANSKPVSKDEVKDMVDLIKNLNRKPKKKKR